MNAGFKAEYVAPNAADWVAQTYITDDTQMLTARANEGLLKWLAAQIEQARAFGDVAGIEPRDRRALCSSSSRPRCRRRRIRRT